MTHMEERPLSAPLPHEEEIVAALDLDEIDRHFGAYMCQLAGTHDEALALAAALASRATRQGDVCVDLADALKLPGVAPRAPSLQQWLADLRASPVVGTPGAFRPLVLDGDGRLYLYRYWEYERRLAELLLARAVDAEGIDEPLLRAGLERLFPDPADGEQKLAAATAILRRLCVISGGPGTGKTTTVVKLLGLLVEQARGRKLVMAIAAPTGKAAARVHAAMRAAMGRLNADEALRDQMPDEAFTLHRLLGARPDSVKFRHSSVNPLPLDVLVVDEASMADLALFTKLVEALPERTRLILLGDKDQLASVEAGAVLGDLCRNRGYSARFAKRLARLTGIAITRIPTSAMLGRPLSDSIALLERSYRFHSTSGIGVLARAVNAGDGDRALALLQGGAYPDVRWRTVASTGLRAQLAGLIGEAWQRYFEAIQSGASPQDLFALFNAFRVLCAHRTGPFGVGMLNVLIEDLLEEQRCIVPRDGWYPGRPVMITRNDYQMGLFNGDVGITVRGDNGLEVVFEEPSGAVRRLARGRLPGHETVYAMTLHKSQGSEFARVLMVLPDALSPILTRELVYTGITRAMQRVEIWGEPNVFGAAVRRRHRRASALGERLWTPIPGELETNA